MGSVKSAYNMDSINQKIGELQKCLLLLQTETVELRSELEVHRYRLVELSIDISRENIHGYTGNRPEEDCGINESTFNDKLNHTYFPDKKQKNVKLKNRISDIQLKTFACDECNYVAFRKCLIDRHVKQVHLKIKEFEYDTWSYTYSQKQQLIILIKCGVRFISLTYHTT